MFQDMLISGLVTPLCDTSETNGWENRPFRTVYPQQLLSKTHKGQVTRTISRKPKRNRTAYTTDQIKGLEKAFSRSRYVDQQSRKELARQLNIEDKCVKIWFQNRRMKEKKDSESSCDSSTEYFSNLSSNNYDSNDEIVIDNKRTLEAQPNLIPASEPSNLFSKYQPLDTTPYFYNAVPCEYQYPYQALDFYNYPQDCQYSAPNFVTPNTTFYYDTNVRVYPTEYCPNSQQHAYETQQSHWVSELPDLINYLG